ncbi:MAG TPA: YMGG-like glycine zipper-containing protein [Pyrinomonadaceae bacterium]|nr:YMGG-like glycine zipper-containing protein [Pyrinomonadaceae bacterium]
MRRRLIATALSVTCLLLLPIAAQAQTRTYRGTFQTVRRLIVRIENRSANFSNSLQNWASRNPNATYSPAAGEDINLFVRDFDESVRRLRDRFDARQATASDVQDVLNRAARIDVFLGRHAIDARTRNQWSLLRTDLNQLGSAFNVRWPQVGTTYPPNSNTYPPYDNTQGQFRTGLTGTYRVDVSRSDNARDAAERATRNLALSERRRVLDAVTQRLEAPNELALDVRGRNVTIASTRAPQISFVADGRERIETSSTGRTIRSRATVSGDQLMVSTTGDRGNDFSVTFDSVDNGRRLNVTRRIYVQGLTSPVVVQSSYDKTSDVARFDIHDPRNVPSSTASGGFVVPDGTRIVGTLENTLSTRASRVGDRFTMRVIGPREFEGAIIEGHVSQVERSGRLTGRSVLTLDFDSIRLRDGRSHQFAGMVEEVRETDGDIVRVDTEGTVRDDSQTSRTTTRTAIGTAVGAIIGAIAGGGKGAAIGAILGAGGGAGSVYVEGRNDLELQPGTEITLRAGAPNTTLR